MSCHSCNSCNSQSSQSSSISDFFPSGYRFTSGYPKYPYYISVPVFVEEEEEEEDNTSTKEYDEPPGMSSRKNISGHFIQE